MSNGGPWWLAIILTFLGPLAGFAVYTWGHARWTERDDRRDGEALVRSRREELYLGVFLAGSDIEAAIAEGRSQAAVDHLRMQARTAMFLASAQVARLLTAVVDAAVTWAALAVAASASSADCAAAAQTFRDCLAAATQAMRAEVRLADPPAARAQRDRAAAKLAASQAAATDR